MPKQKCIKLVIQEVKKPFFLLPGNAGYPIELFRDCHTNIPHDFYTIQRLKMKVISVSKAKIFITAINRQIILPAWLMI